MKRSNSGPHVPVLLDECLECFADCELKVFFEGTLGAGGHAEAILKAHPEIETYFGCDRDKQALEIAKKRLEPWKDKMVYVHGNFADLDKALQNAGVKEVNGFFLTWGYRQCS